MRRIVSLLTVLLLCAALACPVLAAEDKFVPSISYKDGPVIEEAVIVKPKPDDDKPDDDKPDDDKPDDDKPDDDKPDDEENERHDVIGCLVVTSVPQAKNKSTDIDQESRDLLIRVYEELAEGTVDLPVRDHMVIRELVDISFQEKPCVESDHTHQEDLRQNETTITAILNLGIKPNTDVVVLTFHEGEWKPIVKVINNNDGTVTCTFANEGPIAFLVDSSDMVTPPQTGDTMGSDLILWSGLLVLSIAAMAVLLVLRRRSAR